MTAEVGCGDDDVIDTTTPDCCGQDSLISRACKCSTLLYEQPMQITVSIKPVENYNYNCNSHLAYGNIQGKIVQ